MPFDRSWASAVSFHYRIRKGVTIGNREAFGPWWSQDGFIVKWYQGESDGKVQPCFAPIMWFKSKFETFGVKAKAKKIQEANQQTYKKKRFRE